MIIQFNWKWIYEYLEGKKELKGLSLPLILLYNTYFYGLCLISHSFTIHSLN